jgi:predicted MFS family arabinose efflux permease
MSVQRYRALWADAQLRRILLMGLCAKIPVVAIPALLTLHVVLGLKAGFAAAGAVNAAWLIGAAIGVPIQGRWMDRRGLRAVLALVLVVQCAFWMAAPTLPLAWLLPAAGLAGAFCFAAFTIGRMAIAQLATEPDRHTAYAFDAITTEMAYMSGPPLAVVACAWISSAAALHVVGAAIVMSGLLYVVAELRTSARPQARAASTPRGIAIGALLPSLAMTAVATLLIASYEVAGLALLKSMHQMPLASVFYIVCGVASLAGGAFYGAAAHPPSAFRLVIGLALATAIVALAPGAGWVCLFIAPAAALCAPVMAATASDVSRAAPAQHKGLAMGLYGTALTIGNAVGFPLAGLVSDALGPAAAFELTGALGLCVALLARVLMAASGQHAAPTEVGAAAALNKGQES